jgi:ribonuclease HI
VIKPKDIAETEARNVYNSRNAALELAIWTDGSKLDTGGVGAGVTWKRDNIWRQKGYSLGSTKEVFDAELHGIRNALYIAIKGGQMLKRSLQLARYPYNRIIVLSDSQAALQRAQNDQLGPGQTLAREIIANAQELRDEGVEVTLQWVPSHIGIEGNERADKIAKEAATKPAPPGMDRYSSFSYITRQVKAQKRLETRDWLYKATYKGEIKKRNRAYTLTESLELEPQISMIRKPLAKRFYQLKIGHAITASYLHRIKRSSTPRCWWCGATKQDIDHLLFECRRWSTQRRALYSDLRRLGITTPRMSEERPKNRLFNTPKAIIPILDFLNATSIGQRPREREEEEESWERLDRWDLDRLDSEEREIGD